MFYNHLINEFVVEPSDYVSSVLNYFKNCDTFHDINIVFETKKGFTTDVVVSSKKGIYVIYKDKTIPVYVGSTQRCIHARVSRFLSGIRGTENRKESHPGAYRYLEIFGDDYSNLSFKFIEINNSKLAEGCEVVDIEQLIIKELSPLCNSETCKNYKIERYLDNLQKNFKDTYTFVSGNTGFTKVI